MKAGWAVAVGLLVLSAGCLGDSDSKGDKTEAPTSAPPATVTETTGGIQGQVLTDEGLPAAGVNLGLLEALHQTRSDAMGNFSFSKLEPRNYRILYERFGFRSGVQEVTVVAGEITEVQIQLVSAAPPKPYNRTVKFAGYIQVGVPGSGTFDEDQCKCSFDFRSNASLKSLVLELKMQPTVQGPFGNSIFVSLWSQEGWDKAGIDDPATYADRDMSSGDKIQIDEGNRNWTAGEAFHVQTYCGADFICYEQDFEIYVTYFYHTKAPAGFSALRT